jgi:YgiT-type zinc finger domain-containing protein
MKCIICEIGELKPGKTTVTLKRGESIIVFDDVPALICENCGEEFFDEEINGKLLEKAELIVQTHPKLGIFSFEVPRSNGSHERAIV